MKAMQRSLHNPKSLLKRALLGRYNTSKLYANPKERGFTLIELLVVVIIIGVLSAIAVPAFVNQSKKAVAAKNNSLAMDTARACAAALVGGDAAPTNPTGVTGTCQLNTTFTAADTATTKRATDAVATISSDGGVSLTTTSVPQ